MIELLENEYKRKSWGLTDTISIDIDKNSEICTEEGKIHEIKSKLCKTKPYPPNQIHTEVISPNIVKDFKNLIKNKKSSMIAFYGSGIQKCGEVVSVRQNHFRVKSFRNSESKKNGYRSLHHSQVKKNYIEQAVGDIGVPGITLTPENKHLRRKSSKFSQCLNSKNYSTELVGRQYLTKVMPKVNSKCEEFT